MQLVGAHLLKQATDLTPGELFWLPSGNRGRLCALLNAPQHDHRNFFVAFVDSEINQLFLPTLEAEAIEGSVLSYGENWVMDITSSPDIAETFHVGQAVGAVVLVNGLRLLSVGDAFGRRRLFINLTNFTVLEAAPNLHTGLSALHWSIWASEDDRSNPSRKPLLARERASHP